MHALEEKIWNRSVIKGNEMKTKKIILQ